MSSILKALKKLEEDKVRRGERAVDLAIDIHRGGHRRHQRGLPWRVLALVVLAGLVIGAFWLSTNRTPGSNSAPENSVISADTPKPSATSPTAILEEKQGSSAMPLAESTAANPAPPFRPVPLAPTKAAVQAPPSSASDAGTVITAVPSPVPSAAYPVAAQPASRQPSNEPAPAPNTSTPAETPTAPSALPATTSTAPTATPLAIPAPSGPSVPVSSESAPSGETAARKSPELRLTGIVWQDDPSERMAIINDLPVMVGTVIGGATVEKIQADRVFVRMDGVEKELVLSP